MIETEILFYQDTCYSGGARKNFLEGPNQFFSGRTITGRAETIFFPKEHMKSRKNILTGLGLGVRDPSRSINSSAFACYVDDNEVAL